MKKLSILLTFLTFFAGILNGQTKNQGQPVKSVNVKLIGSWEVWIPGAVTYTATDRAVYQSYSPGAAMNRLDIGKDGSYQWGNKKGRLLDVQPWHAQENRRYYQISDMKGNEFDFWYDESKDNLIVLFGGVGGHAATGSRLTEKITQTTSAPDKKETVQSAKTDEKKNNIVNKLAKQFKVGEKVEIEWKGQWYKGAILQVNKDTYKVSYDGWGSLYDEWVSVSRIREAKK